MRIPDSIFREKGLMNQKMKELEAKISSLENELELSKKREQMALNSVTLLIRENTELFKKLNKKELTEINYS